MEEKTPPSTTPPPASRTAEALRELHDRARTALAAQRERMGKLEAQLTHQLDSIADTLARQIAAHGDEAGDVQYSAAEVEHLRQELDRARAAWKEEREQLTAEVETRSRQLDERQAELDAQSEQLTTGLAKLDARQQTLDDRATELNHRDRELRQHHELLESYAKQCGEQQSRLTESQTALDKQKEALAVREAAIESSQKQIDQSRDELAARNQAWQNDQQSLAAGRNALQTEQDALKSRLAALEAERDALHAEHQALQAERDSFSEKLNSLANTSQASGDELKSQLARAEAQFAAERATWEKERGTVDEARRLLANERDELTAALAAASAELETAREQAGAADERDKVQQKFELALQDVQRLRSRIGELEQELASRPAADQTDSVELVHLRSERDAMAEQIAELEQRAATPVNADTAQETADLQRRFELAVEDVRDLKKQVSQLESKLAAAKSSTTAASPAAGDGGSWEAMKKQMLESLEDEGGDVDEVRHVERTRIESTIRITDEAMAQKDLEIAELRAKLADDAGMEQRDSEAVRQLVDSDSVIQEHRARIAKLESETQDKLRAAELELSVERAKIAREAAKLADLKAEIDSHRGNNDEPHGPGSAPQSKRRWLSKLGLSGDEE